MNYDLLVPFGIIAVFLLFAVGMTLQPNKAHNATAVNMAEDWSKKMFPDEESAAVCTYVVSVFSSPYVCKVRIGNQTHIKLNCAINDGCYSHGAP